MDARLIALKLFLEELGVKNGIDTIEDRKNVQKAVYLGQQTGVDLGYRFGWYVKGPYSPALTKDYYSLAEAIATGDDEYKQKTFPKTIKERISKAKPLFKKPEGLELENHEWIELVASFHFLRNVSKYSEDETVKIIEKEKPHLSIFCKDAIDAINNNPLN